MVPRGSASSPRLAGLSRPTVVEVSAPHCIECRAMAADLDAVARRHRDTVDLVIVDAKLNAAAASELHVLATPTLIAVQGGTEVARFVGRRNRRELDELFTAVAAGKTDEVAQTTGSDRVVWGVGGVALGAAGLLSGPAWPLVGIGSALVVVAALRGRKRSHPR